ncbi:MAG: serine--tRNA ligase, partial [Flexibacteraceae bacterium]
MLPIQLLREETEKVITGLEKRGVPNASEKVAAIIETDDARKQAQLVANDLQAKANAASGEIGKLMKDGNKDAAEALKAEVSVLKEQIKAADDLMKQKESEIAELLVLLPNVPCYVVKAGKSAEDNEIMSTWGEIPTLHAEAQPHWELIKKYDIIDFELGVKVS